MNLDDLTLDVEQSVEVRADIGDVFKGVLYRLGEGNTRPDGVSMNLTLEEALVAATLNAAASLDRVDSIGSLEAGKQFDAVVVSGMLTDLIRVGGPVVRQVIKHGRIVFHIGV